MPDDESIENQAKWLPNQRIMRPGHRGIGDKTPYSEENRQTASGAASLVLRSHLRHYDTCLRHTVRLQRYNDFFQTPHVLLPDVLKCTSNNPFWALIFRDNTRLRQEAKLGFNAFKIMIISTVIFDPT